MSRFGTRTTFVAAASSGPGPHPVVVALGSSAGWIWLLLGRPFVGGVGNMLMIVGFMVTATLGLPDAEQGLATVWPR